MSEENVEIVRKLAEQFNLFMRGELSSEALAEPFDPGIELHWHGERTYPDTHSIFGAPQSSSRSLSSIETGGRT
ncbi:MAG: hypothetical protein WA696_16130 [Solirubrobacterales bacterium]